MVPFPSIEKREKMKFFYSLWTTVHANDNDAFIPEVWAAESLMVLTNNVVASMLVHRNFENSIASFGDTVNTRIHGTFSARRKTDDDDVTVQDASSTNVAVKLDQHLHTSFLIKDGEETKGFKVLRDEYLVPGMVSLAQQLDEIIVSQLYHFRHQSVGQLGVTPTRSLVTAARGALNDLRVPTQGRKMLVGTNTETALLNIDDFVQADKLGDEGSAMREGSLGRKFGMDIFMDQNVPSVRGTTVVANGLINFAAGYAAGSTVLTVDTFTGTLPLVNGAWLVIAGDLTPLQIVSTVGGATPTSITIAAPGLREAVIDNAAITVYDSGQINAVGGYSLDYGKKLTLDELTAAPKKGQLISIGAAQAATGETTSIHAATNGPDRSTTEVWLDRPLRAAAADNAVVGLGPDGEYNFAFHEMAIALVTRPLAPPQSGTGALSTVMNWQGYSIRVTITYNGTKQGHLVTLDILAGVKVLDTRLGVVVYA
jgi:hypothetical protein